MEIDGSKVAERLRECAHAAGMSQSEVARGAGLNSATVSRYFNGARVPSPGELLDLARLFGVSMEWLLTGESRAAEDLRMKEAGVAYGSKRRQILEQAAEELEAFVRQIRREAKEAEPGE